MPIASPAPASVAVCPHRRTEATGSPLLRPATRVRLPALVPGLVGKARDQLTSSGCYRSRQLAVSDGTGDRSDSDGRGVGRLVTVRYQRLRAPRLGGGPGGDHVVVCHRKPQSSPPPRREPPAPAGYFQRQLNGVRPAPALSTVQASLSSNAFAFFSPGASKPSDYERRPACSGHARVGQGPKQGC